MRPQDSRRSNRHSLHDVLRISDRRGKNTVSMWSRGLASPVWRTPGRKRGFFGRPGLTRARDWEIRRSQSEVPAPRGVLSRARCLR